MSDALPPLEGYFPTENGVPESWRHTPDETGLTLLIDGTVDRWNGPAQTIRSAVCVRDAAGALRPVPLGPAAQASEPQGLAAVRAAAKAWKGGRGEWPRSSVAARIACVEDFVKRMVPLREPVARALMWEVGKPYADCLTEFDRTVRYIEETVASLRDLEGESAAPVVAGGFAARVRRAPLGVALCMGPYNYAVNEVFTTVVPALIMGNPVVMKTPRYGVLSNARLVPAMADAFPPGVVNFVTGPGPSLIGPVMESGLVDVLALIGSARTAAVLQRQHPRPYRLRSILGMGAKNPGIVLADADLDRAAAEIVSGALTFNGQRCTAIKHVFAAAPVAEALVEKIVARVNALKVGMPWEPGVSITPMPDPEHPAFLDGLVRDAVARGARVVNPGGGAFAATLYRPAVVYPVPLDALLAHDEQFGPVVPITAFRDPAEVLDVVDRAEVGQQAAIFGGDPKVMGPMIDHLTNMVCRVNVNTQCRRGPDVLPFTGRKDSAMGTLSIRDALRTFSIRSVVSLSQKEEALLRELGETSSFLAPPPA